MTRSIAILVLLGTSALAAAQAPALSESKADAAYAPTDSITMDVTSCFAACVTTRTVVTRLGLVSVIPSPGPSHGSVRTATMTPQMFSNLVTHVKLGRFLDIPELIAAEPKYCPAPVKGGIEVRVTLWAPGLSHRVVDPQNCQWAPGALREFEQALRQLASKAN
jgi:hypothetical protein